MRYEQISYEVGKKILTLTLNRPDKLNAYTQRMCNEMISALERADEDDEIRAIVVTGAGRAFCAGADLSAGASTFDFASREPRATRSQERDSGGVMSLRVLECKKPIIAAVNGAAVGIGVTMTLPMDIRIASERAKFGFVFARRGITPEACSTWLLPRVVGMSQATEWVFTGRIFGPDEAHRGGLVSRVVKSDALLPTAYEIAREIVENTSALSVTLSRHLLWRGLIGSGPAAAHEIESQCLTFMGRSADAREGVASFLEKRAARFSLRPSRDLPDFYPWWQEQGRGKKTPES